MCIALLGTSGILPFERELHLRFFAKARQKMDPKSALGQTTRENKPYVGPTYDMYKDGPVAEHSYRNESNGFVLDCIAVSKHGTALPAYSSPTKAEGEGVRSSVNSPVPGEAFEYDIHGRRVPAGTAAAVEIETY
jgi:hypothetical protein